MHGQPHIRFEEKCFMKILEEENFMLAPCGSRTQRYIKTWQRREWAKLQVYLIYESSQQAAEQNSPRFDANLPGSDDESFNWFQMLWGCLVHRWQSNVERDLLQRQLTSCGYLCYYCPGQIKLLGPLKEEKGPNTIATNRLLLEDNTVSQYKPTK